MRKWVIEFLRKFENRGIKIARVKSIITKSVDLQFFTSILYGVWVRSKAIFRAQCHITENFHNAHKILKIITNTNA